MSHLIEQILELIRTGIEKFYTSYEATKDLSGALKMIPIEHARIHSWVGFRFFDFRQIISSGTNYIQIKTGDKAAHFIFNNLKDTDKTIYISLIETPTLTDWTTQIPVYNANRSSTTNPTLTIFSDPTWISGWTIIDFFFLPAENKNVGETAQIDKEWILKKNTSYVVKIENQVAQATNFITKCFWYEI